MKQLGCMFQEKELYSWGESKCSSGRKARDQRGVHLEKNSLRRILR